MTTMNAWCRAWNDEPGLIESLVTDDVRMWLGSFGYVETRSELAMFVNGFHEKQGLTFKQQQIIRDGDQLAFVWGATTREGERRTGLDVWSLRGDRIAQVWSVAGESEAGLPLDAGEKTDRAVIEAALANWTPMWNGESDVRVSEEFRIWFKTGQTIEGKAAFSDFLVEYQQERPDIRFANHRPPVIDEEHGRAALVWSVARPSAGLELGGIDVFSFRDGLIDQVWSVTGTVAL